MLYLARLGHLWFQSCSDRLRTRVGILSQLFRAEFGLVKEYLHYGCHLCSLCGRLCSRCSPDDLPGGPAGPDKDNPVDMRAVHRFQRCSRGLSSYRHVPCRPLFQWSWRRPDVGPRAPLPVRDRPCRRAWPNGEQPRPAHRNGACKSRTPFPQCIQDTNLYLS